MDKYYTPRAIDVRFGLEYETCMVQANYDSGVFEKKTLRNGHDFALMVHYLMVKPEVMRVKYLDGDDIMSFGFEIANDEGNTYKSLKKRLGMGTGDDKTLFVHHEVFPNNSGQIIVNTHIWWRENRGDEITMFEGSINNKLEFKQILEQIHASNIITKEQ